ncbi:MAG: TonB-dependent receptor, partial [Sphingobacteriales bacterium]
MKKLTLLFFTFFYAFVQGNAQTTFSMSGKIISAKAKEPVTGASLVLMSKDSVVKKLVAAPDGSFQFNIRPGEYSVQADAVNYETFLIENIIITKDSTIATIVLQQKIKQLNEVTVVADKSGIELKADKKVFNVGKDILSKGGNANDILNNVPSVNVDVAGNVSLRGNGSVRILINGKPSMLTNNNGLMQIPAASIEKVEVITNPSSAYEAQGSAGIINIILKKNSHRGFNASLQAGTGSPANNSINANMSYKTKRFNLFSNIGYRYAESFGENRMYRVNKPGTNYHTLRQLDIEKGSNANTSFYVGGDYYFNDKNTLTGSYFHNTRRNKYNVDYNYNYFN